MFSQQPIDEKVVRDCPASPSRLRHIQTHHMIRGTRPLFRATRTIPSHTSPTDILEVTEGRVLLLAFSLASSSNYRPDGRTSVSDRCAHIPLPDRVNAGHTHIFSRALRMFSACSLGAFVWARQVAAFSGLGDGGSGSPHGGSREGHRLALQTDAVTPRRSVNQV